MADDRHRLSYRLRYVREHPDKAVAHVKRTVRNWGIRLRHRDHTSFYREVMRRNAGADPDLSVGSANRDRWFALGQLQYDYLIEHGLQPEHRMLEIGCGNLRAGWRFIDHLDAGNYYGIDASPDILLAAQRTLVEFALQDKLPHLMPVDDLTFAALPADRFDVVHAHSVFSHTPLVTIDECLRHVGRVMTDDGFFDLTFNATMGKEHDVVREDFYYQPQTLIALAKRHGFDAQVMDDWTPRHKQAKLRARRP